jgi:hypothetical protein
MCFLLHTTTMMFERGLNLFGAIKTAHALFPKDYTQHVLGPLPTSSSRIVLRSNAEGEKNIYDVGYKRNRKNVLFLMSTAGVAKLQNREPYMRRWADENGNICTCFVPRHFVVSRYFKDSPKVDNHNHARQHDLAFEELWLA